MNKMKITIVICVLVLTVGQLTFAQAKNEYKGLPSTTWPVLYDVSYKTVTDEYGEYQKPIFSKSVKELEGKEVYIEGYIMPFDGVKSNSFVLSALPINACFFCGNGGPESVIQIHANSEVRYTEKPVEFKGKIKLNPDNPDELIYSLEEAEFSGVLEF